jgi:hypothetical protein
MAVEPEKSGKIAGWWRAKGSLEIRVFTVLSLLLAGGVTGVRLREPTLGTTVQVAVGSEDMGFFRDGQTMAEFAANDFTVVPVPMGSRQMAVNAKTLNAAGYDALFPSSEDFALEIEQKLNPPYGNQQPFSTPLAVFTWRDLLPGLEAAQIVDPAGTKFNLGRYIADTASGTNHMLLDMANPADSDSGAMFLAAASYVLNNGVVVQSASTAIALAPQIRAVVGPLGGTENTTGHVFSQYLEGESAEPLALGYQSEFFEAQQTGALPANAVMLQLDPSINCVHTIVPLDKPGLKFATLLDTDPVLLDLAARKYGFIDSTNHIPPGNYVSAPTPQVLEAMIGAVEQGS